jgi:putative SOS response-associated peptidase YedK
VCGRFNVEQAPLTGWLMQVLGVAHPGPDNHNAAPTESIAVVRTTAAGGCEVAHLRWWFTPHWAKSASLRYSMFNARRETVATSPAFRESYRRRRCIVPVSGFYEWSGRAPDRQPWYIQPRTEGGLLLAGIWDVWSNPTGGNTLESFAVLTTAAHPALRFVHDRQPVMLSATAARYWLAPETAMADLHLLLDPIIPVDLDAVPVSSRVNNARNKASECSSPVGQPVPVAAAVATPS